MSSLVKAEVRIATANEIGVRMDDALEAAKGDVARADGAASAGVKIGDGIDSVVAAMQKDIDEGRLGLEQGKLVATWLARARTVASNYVLGSHQAKSMAQGRVMGFEAAVASVAKFKTEEENKVRAVLTAAAAEDVAPEDVGPKPTIKQQYEAEDALLAQEAAHNAAPVGKKEAKRAKNTR